MKDEPFELVKQVIQLSSDIKSTRDFQYLAFVLKQVGIPFCQQYSVAKNGLFSPELDFMLEHLVENREVVFVGDNLRVAETTSIDDRMVPFVELILTISSIPIQLLKVLSYLYNNGYYKIADRMVASATGVDVASKTPYECKVYHTK